MNPESKQSKIIDDESDNFDFDESFLREYVYPMVDENEKEKDKVKDIDNVNNNDIVNSNLPNDCFSNNSNSIFDTNKPNNNINNDIYALRSYPTNVLSDISVKEGEDDCIIKNSDDTKHKKNNKKINKKNGCQFRFNAASVFLTYSNCEVSKEEMLDFFKNKFDVKSAIISREVHPETQGHHLHCYIIFNKKISTKNARYFDYNNFHPNIGVDKTGGKKSANRSKIDIINYVIKDKDYIEYNINAKKLLAANKAHRALIADELVNGQLNLSDACIAYPSLIFSYSGLQKNLNLFKNSLLSKDYYIERKCFWVYGVAGIGKSYSIRQFFKNDLFLKSQSKWWDGYICQKAVLLDDFDHTELAHELKIWGDNYSFNAEVKCGHIIPTYKYFLITSNFTMEYFFGNIIQTLKAVKRRYIFIDAAKYMSGEYFNFELVAKEFGIEI